MAITYYKSKFTEEQRALLAMYEANDEDCLLCSGIDGRHDKGCLLGEALAELKEPL